MNALDALDDGNKPPTIDNSAHLKPRVDYLTLTRSNKIHAKKLYVEEGFTLERLAKLFRVTEDSLYKAIKAGKWANLRKEYKLNKGVGLTEGAVYTKEVADKMIRIDEQAETEIQSLSEAEALRRKNQIVSQRLQKIQDQLAVALGVHESSLQIAKDNAEATLTTRINLLHDKELSSNYQKVLTSFFESVKLQRLVDGQSTSAANKESPTDEEDTQEHLDVVPLGGVQEGDRLEDLE